MADITTLEDDVLFGSSEATSGLSSLPDEVLPESSVIPSSSGTRLDGPTMSGGFGDTAKAFGRAGLEAVQKFTLPTLSNSMALSDAVLPVNYGEQRKLGLSALARAASNDPRERAEIYRRQGIRSKHVEDLDEVQVWDETRKGWVPEGKFKDNPLSFGSVFANLDMALPAGLAASGVGMPAAIATGLGVGTGLGLGREALRSELLGEPFSETVSGTNVAGDALGMGLSQPLGKVMQAGVKTAGNALGSAYGWVAGKATKEAATDAIQQAGRLSEQLGIDPADFGIRFPSSNGRLSTLKDTARFVNNELKINGQAKVDVQEALFDLATLNPDVADQITKAPRLEMKAQIFNDKLGERVANLNDFYDANNFEFPSGELINDEFIDALTTKMRRVAGGEETAVANHLDSFTRGYLKKVLDRNAGGDEDAYMAKMVDFISSAEMPSREALARQAKILKNPQGFVKPPKMRQDLDISPQTFESRQSFDRWADSKLSSIDSQKILSLLKNEPIDLKLGTAVRQNLDDMAAWNARTEGANAAQYIRGAANFTRDRLRGKVQEVIPDQFTEFAKLNEDVHNLITLSNIVGKKADEQLGVPGKFSDYTVGVINTWWRIPPMIAEKYSKNPAVASRMRQMVDGIKGGLPNVDAGPIFERAKSLGYSALDATAIANTAIQFEASRRMLQMQALFPDSTQEPSFEIFPREISRVTDKYVSELGDKLLGPDAPQEMQELARGPMQDLFSAMDNDDTETIRASLETLATQFPDLFEGGYGFGGKITSENGRKLYLNELERKSIEGDAQDRLRYLRQMSAFNKKDYRIIDVAKPKSSKPTTTRNTKPREGKREYSY